MEPAIIYSTSKRVCNNFEGVEPIDYLNHNKQSNKLNDRSPDKLPEQQQSDSILEFENLEKKCTLEVD